MDIFIWIYIIYILYLDIYLDIFGYIFIWIAQLVSILLIRWIVIYPADSAVHRLNNPGYRKKPIGFMIISRWLALTML